MNEYISSKQRSKSLKSIFFHLFCSGCSILIQESQTESSAKVSSFRAFILKRRCFSSFKLNQDQSRSELHSLQVQLSQVRLRLVLQGWKASMLSLRSERQQYDAEMQNVISGFRLRWIGRLAWKQWKRFLEDQRDERDRQRFKDNIWNKVNGWLSEIDDKYLELK